MRASHAIDVDSDKRIDGEQTLREISAQEGVLGVVATDSVGHLGEVVGAEREESCVGGEFGGAQSSGDLDHGADRNLAVESLPQRPPPGSWPPSESVRCPSRRAGS